MARFGETTDGTELPAGAIRSAGIPWFDIAILYAVLIGLIGADVLFVLLGGFSVVPRVPLQDAMFGAVFAGIGAVYALTGRSRALATLLFVVAALVFGAPAIMILDFMTKAMGFTMADPALDAWDRLLGLDWIGYERWFSSHPGLSLVSGVLYSCAPLVLLVAFVALSWTRRLQELAWLAIVAALSLIVCVAIGGFLPAAGPHHFYGVPDQGKAFWVQKLIEVVSERPRLIDLGSQPPMTTFPSFHTTLAILITLACWRIRVFGPIFAAFNLFWALSIPVWGSHYFVDILVGALIAIVGYGLVRFAAHRRSERTLPIAGAVHARTPEIVEAGERVAR